MANDTKQPGNNQERDENAVKLLRVLFHDVYCSEHNVEPERKHTVSPMAFYQWLDEHWQELDEDEISEKAGTEADTWAFVREVVDSGNAVAATHAIWLMITLSHRPLPAMKVKSVNVLCNITYEDGSISTTQGFVVPEMMYDPTKAFDDSLAFTTMRNVMQQVLDSAMGSGLAGLHAETAKNQFTSQHPNDPFEVLMGWIIKHMLKGEPMPGKLDPMLIKPVETYMRLAQQCIRPPIPQHVLERMKANRKAAVEGKPKGGWNA